VLKTRGGGNQQCEEWRELELDFKDENDIFGKIIDDRYVAQMQFAQSVAEDTVDGGGLKLFWEVCLVCLERIEGIKILFFLTGDIE
jgi:hypothetical protein